MEILWKKECEFSAYKTHDKSDEPYQETIVYGDIDEVKMSKEKDGKVDICFVDTDPALFIFDVPTNLFEEIEREY